MIGPNETATKKTHPFSFHCDVEDCYWITAHKSQEDAERVADKHAMESCPLNGQQKRIMDAKDGRGARYTVPGLGKTPVEFAFDEMDAIVATLKEDEKLSDDHPDKLDRDVRSELKGKCRGIAFFVSKMYLSFYNSEVAVLQEVNKRWKISKGLIDWEHTPMYHHNPAPSDLAVPYEKPINTSLDRFNKTQRKTTKKSAPKKVAGQLPPDKHADVKAALASGVFTEDKLAGVYKVDVAEIRRVAAL